ncbi:cold-shock protein [Bradyrhizobium sp. Cp5.3]|uniref:cold-shock protein n=1 Tax=Bradyrhizobium sp. Cp5.3 TaxID=443598 RepID=UPI003528EFDB
MIYWNRDRHYGFIRCDDGGDDQFVHVSVLIDSDRLYVGDAVLFEVARDGRSRRERAVNVMVQNLPVRE